MVPKTPFFPQIKRASFTFLSLTTVSPGVQANNSLFPRYPFLYSIKLSFKLKTVILPSFFQAHCLQCYILIQSSLQPSLVLKPAKVAIYLPCLKEGSLLSPGSLQNQSQRVLNALLEGRESSGMKSRNHILCPLSAAQSAAAPVPFKAPCSSQADGQHLQRTRACFLLSSSPLLAPPPRTSAAFGSALRTSFRPALN